MKRIDRPESDRNAQFRWQMDFLRSSIDRYESGFENEAIRIASVLRICLHDKGGSRGLFGQMGFIEHALWLDTAPVGPRSGWSFLNVISSNSYVSRLSASVAAEPNCPRVPFSDWWTQPILTDCDRRWYSREDIVLHVVNQDGGAHIDPRLSEQYFRLSRQISLGVPAQTHRDDIVMQSPAWESIRQIAFEVQETLYVLFDYSPWFLPTLRKPRMEGVPHVRIDNVTVDVGYGEQPVFPAGPSPELLQRMEMVGMNSLPTAQTPAEVLWTPQVAERLAGQYLASLGDRWIHVQGVGRRASQARELHPEAVSERVVVAAWLHDIGYGPLASATGFHPLDGAMKLRNLQAPHLVVSLVAHHSGALFEAVERDMVSCLDQFQTTDLHELDMLTYFNMTTSPQGEEVLVADRLDEILGRYDPEHVVHKAVLRSAPELTKSCERALARLNKPINGIV